MKLRIAMVALLIARALPAAEYHAPTVVEALKWARNAKSLSERIERLSLRFIGAPFADDPLGEGPRGEYDRDPLSRFDKFDCTTYVETVLALALAHSPGEFEKILPRVRYRRGQVRFSERNHFPDADWIPNNTAAGFVTDITAEVAGPLGVKTATPLVDKRGWYAALRENVLQGIPQNQHEARLAKLHAEGGRYKPQTVSVPYIAFEHILARREIPESEAARRKSEEEAVLEKYRALPAPANDEEKKKREEAQHTELVALRQSYALAEGEVDPEFLKRIPSGTILNIVRPNWKIAGTSLSITHQGFVIQKADGAYFRHGSRSGGERLKDVTLASYLKLCLLSPAIKGINLLRINDRPVAAQ